MSRFLTNGTEKIVVSNYILAVVGNGLQDYIRTGVSADNSGFGYTKGVCVDSLGNLFVTDYFSSILVMIPKVAGTYFGVNMPNANYIYTIAGTGTDGAGADNVVGTSSALGYVTTIILDSQENIYLADSTNHKIRMLVKVAGTYFGKAMTANYIYTLAGTGTLGAGADNVAGTSSALNNPVGCFVDLSGNLYICDTNNDIARMIPKVTGTYFGISMTANYIYTITGFTNRTPTTISGDYLGNLFVLERVNCRIKMLVNVRGIYFGNTLEVSNSHYVILNGGISNPEAMCMDPLGNIILTDTSTRLIKMFCNVSGIYYGVLMSAGNIYTIAGAGNSNNYTSIDGDPLTSNIQRPTGICIDTLGNLYISDENNNNILKIFYYTNISYNKTNDGGITINNPPPYIPYLNIAQSSQGIYENNVYNIAGNGGRSINASNNVIATSVSIAMSGCFYVDSLGNIYTSESGYVRMVPNKTGTYFGQYMQANHIYLLTGNGPSASDGVLATDNALVPAAENVYVDSAGNLYIAGYINIRMIPKVTGTYFGQNMTANYIYTIVGRTTYGTPNGSTAEGIAAKGASLTGTRGMVVDSLGNLITSDYNTNVSGRIRMIPKVTGTYFGQNMTANYIYTIVSPSQANEFCLDSLENLYFVEANGYNVKMLVKVSGTYFGQTMTANNIYTIAGTATQGAGADNVVGTSSALGYVSSTAFDKLGNLYICDRSNTRIRVIPKVAGTYFGTTMQTANYIYTLTNLTSLFTAGGTTILSPSTVRIDSAGNLWFSIDNKGLISFISASTFLKPPVKNSIYTIAGTGSQGVGSDNVLARFSALNYPNSTCVDSLGNIYIADLTNNRIRMIAKVPGTYFGKLMTAFKIYTIVSSTGPLVSSLSYPRIANDSQGNIYIIDSGNNVIKMIPFTNGTYFGTSMTAYNIFTIAGTGTAGAGTENAAATSSALRSPYNCFVDSFGNLYIADTGNHKIRMVPNTSGNYFNIEMTANYMYTIAGNGTGSLGGENASALISPLYSPSCVFVDLLGNLYIAEYNNSRIRMVPKISGTYFNIAMTANYIYTLAGTGTLGAGSDNVLATSSALAHPNGVCVDPSGNLYIADTENNKIKMVPKISENYFGINMTANYVYTIAGTGSTAIGLEGFLSTKSTLNSPSSLFIDKIGNIYVTETGNGRIRIIISGRNYYSENLSANSGYYVNNADASYFNSYLLNYHIY